MYIKLCFICLLSFVLSCNNKTGPSENRAEAKVREVTATGHGVDPGAFPGTDSVNLNSKYINTRYGFYLSFPAADVNMESESDSRDGCIFFTTEMKELGRVYRIANPDPAAGPISLKKELESDLSYFRGEGYPVQGIYSRLGETFYVVSAKVNNKIYYRKGILLDGDDMAKVIFQYDEEQKAKYDVIVAAMANSFHK